MRDQDINALLDEHIDGFHTSLTKTYTRARGYPKDFDALPKNVQLALFDLIFNVGATGLTRFTQLNSSIKSADWKKAAEQCRRSRVGNARNEYVRKLLLTTSGES